MPKYLFTFEKGEPVRWLGHLDILRTFERAVRRAGLPIAFTNGFNPRERLVFASALSTGVTGEAEPASLELTELLPQEEIVQRLNDALPPGIRIRQCELVPDSSAKEQLNNFDCAAYKVVCHCSPDTQLENVEAAMQSLLAQPQISLLREREGRAKTVDIRPFLYSLCSGPESRTLLAQSRLSLEMIIGQGEGVMVRPAEVVGALAAYVPGLAVRRSHRVRLMNSKEERY